MSGVIHTCEEKVLLTEKTIVNRIFILNAYILAVSDSLVHSRNTEHWVVCKIWSSLSVMLMFKPFYQRTRDKRNYRDNKSNSIIKFLTRILRLPLFRPFLIRVQNMNSLIHYVIYNKLIDSDMFHVIIYCWTIRQLHKHRQKEKHRQTD